MYIYMFRIYFLCPTKELFKRKKMTVGSPVSLGDLPGLTKASYISKSQNNKKEREIERERENSSMEA